MKGLSRVLLITLSIFLSACTSVYQSGTIGDRDVVVPPFNGVNANGNFDVHFIRSHETYPHIVLTGDTDIIQDVYVRVMDKTLYLSMNKGHTYTPGIRIRAEIPVGDKQGIHIALGGTAIADARHIAFKTAYVSASGKSHAYMHVTDELSAFAAGDASVYFDQNPRLWSLFSSGGEVLHIPSSKMKTLKIPYEADEAKKPIAYG